MKRYNPKQCNADQQDLQHKDLSKHKTFAAHFSHFNGTPVWETLLCALAYGTEDGCPLAVRKSSISERVEERLHFLEKKLFGVKKYSQAVAVVE